jgi:hypothetical protein
MIGHNRAGEYDREFYDDLKSGSLRSASVIIPVVLGHVPVQSAIDIGCGQGAWLRVLEECGVRDILGYDGDHVERSRLLIDPAKFKAVDLREDFKLDRTCDLAISLEVAEHLPNEFAEPLVRRLVTAAPVVLFSAAIPAQGGTEHVNERWQDYWRNVFRSFDFFPVDLIRPAVWGNPDVEFWYQQNIILYCSDYTLHKVPGLRPVSADVSLNIVHPTLYEKRVTQQNLQLNLRKILKLILSLTWNAALGRTRFFRMLLPSQISKR